MPRRSHKRTPGRCCTASTSCRLIRELYTRWWWSHSKSSTLQCQLISAVTYSPATVCGIYGRQTLLCCVNLSSKLASPDVVFITQLPVTLITKKYCNWCKSDQIGDTHYQIWTRCLQVHHCIRSTFSLYWIIRITFLCDMKTIEMFSIKVTMKYDDVFY